MKKNVAQNRIFTGLTALVIIALSLISTSSSTPRVAAMDQPHEVMVTPQAQACGATSWDLTAGQSIDVGTVTVSNDATNLYVTYSLDDPDYPNACFGTLHVWAGDDLLNVPANPQGTPVPGHFCSAQGGDCHDATGLKSYTFTIPLADLGITNVQDACQKQLFVVTHAEVYIDCNDKTEHETAFGGDVEGPGNRWWFYSKYNVCCGAPVPFCETAYAKGGFVWTTDRKSNPENLPSLNLTKNRWGWAIKLCSPGEYSYDIWAGAGLNKIGNGTKVGTLYVRWDGTNASVKYDMAAGFYLGEVHLWARNESPNTIAPGQYGFIDEFDPNAGTHTFNVPLADTDADGCVWIVAHAVVCNVP